MTVARAKCRWKSSTSHWPELESEASRLIVQGPRSLRPLTGATLQEMTTKRPTTPRNPVDHPLLLRTAANGWCYHLTLLGNGIAGASPPKGRAEVVYPGQWGKAAAEAP